MPELLPVTTETLVDASIWVSAFVVALFVGSIVLPGFHHEGQPLRDGKRLPYKLSGLVLFGATHVVLAAGVLGLGWSLAPLVTHFWSLFVVANVWAFGISVYLLIAGRRKDASRNILADAWLGAELNPRLFGVDLKMFMYHPSLIGLAVMNAAFAFVQFERWGALSPEMVLYQAFTWAYLFTHYIKERFMLSTWDIIAERFGFMLVWGDLVYVPFLYSMVAWWVVDRGWSDAGHEPWPIAAYVGLVGIHVMSHWVFRGSNWQKDRFKRDPKAKIWGRTPELLGGKLLVSGWWGIGRKINYTGEIGVYLSWALCAGFAAPYPYLLPASLFILLTQRAWRDDRRCRAKYGELWDRYCERAKFKMLPFIY